MKSVDWTRHHQNMQRRISPERVHLPPFQLARWLTFLHRRCALCQALSEKHSVLCRHCQSQISTKLSAIKIVSLDTHTALRLYPVSYYQHPVNHLISRFKENEEMAAFLGLLQLLYQLPKPLGCHKENTVIIPVPSSAKRLVRRGFNPVLMLAKHLAYHWQLPIWQGVARHDNVQHQRGLDKNQRLSNAQNDYFMLAPVPCLRAIIFDDVVTTGATIQAVAAQIQQQQPNVQLLAVCLAHGTAEFSLASG